MNIPHNSAKQVNPKKHKSVAKHCNGNREEITAFYMEEIAKNPLLLIQNSNITAYLSEKIRMETANRILKSNKPEEWFPQCDRLAEILPSNIVRQKILEVFQNSPKILQNSAEQVGKIFSEEHFNQFLREGRIPESTIISLFLTFHSFKTIATLNGEIRRILEYRSKDAQTVPARVEWSRDPFGFACGWMENNFYQAATNEECQGLCLVNNCLFAKFFHHNWDPKKVTYLPAKTYKSQNDYIIWEDFFYSPSNGQEKIIQDAIKSNQKHVYIPDLQIKAIRPAFGITSQQIRELTHHIYHGLII